MLHNPGFFEGVWATSPDPADFRDFFGVNLSPGSTQNMYRTSAGAPLPAARNGALAFDTLREYIEADLAGGGGDIASYEAAFSEKDPHTGLPFQLFERTSGALIQGTLTQWQRFDLRSLLSTMPSENIEKVRDRLHIWVGEQDDFFLERPTQSFCDEARRVGLRPECVVVPGRGHRDLYLPEPTLFPAGLLTTILTQAAASASGVPR